MSIIYNSPSLISEVKRWANQHKLLKSRKIEVPSDVLKELTNRLSKTTIEFNKESILKILESL